MKEIVARFSQQIREAIDIAREVKVKHSARRIENVLVCGLGGSGIGGKIIGQLFSKELKVPFSTSNDYDVPAFVGPATLVIASSYSGTTEETISALEKCQVAGSEIAVVTSGGTLKRIADESAWTCAVIPGGEQPRAMLVFSLVQLINFLVKYGLIHPANFESLYEIPDFIDSLETKTISKSKELAMGLKGRIPIIYSASQNEALSVRFRQQLNENCKLLCWHHALPEMTHNELVGWGGGDDRFAVIWISCSGDHARTLKRWEFCKTVIAQRTKSIFEISAQGKNDAQQLFYIIHLTDWVSVELARLLDVDAVEVAVISRLKEEMGNTK